MKKKEEGKTDAVAGRDAVQPSADAFRYARKNESLFRAKQVAVRKGRVTMIFLRQQRRGTTTGTTRGTFCQNDGHSTEERRGFAEWKAQSAARGWQKMFECSSQTAETFLSHDRTGNKHETW